MTLTGLSCIYVFLPLSLLIYYLLPVRFRTGALLVISLSYYLLAAPRQLPVMLLCVLLDYIALRVMDAFEELRIRRACFWFSVVKNLGFIVFMTGLTEIHRIDSALGGLIYTLSAMECVASAYWRQTPPERNILRFGLHCCFFPKLYAGPLQEYRDYLDKVEQIRWDGAGILEGFGKFAQGVIKSVLLGDYLLELYQTLRLYGDEASLTSGWLLVLTLALRWYYRWSGLCDMAVGIGRMFGLRLPQNFYYPYQSRSVEDFIQRFNSTVWAYIRRFVYSNLQEDKNGPLADSINLLICGMLAGLWFGLRINLLLWGVYLAVFVIMERYLYKGILARVPTLFRRGYTLAVVLIGFTLLAGETPAQSFSLFRQLFRLDPIPVINGQVIYLLSTSWPVLLLSCFFATNACSLAAGHLRKALPQLYAAVSAAVGIALLVAATALKMA